MLVSYTEHRHGHVAEYYALLAAAGGGMIFLTQANTLMTLFLGLEWFSISLYILCAIDDRRERSLEAGLKYLVIGGFGSAVLLFGSALVYGATGKLTFDGIAEAVTAAGLSHDALLLTGLAMIIVGLGFKASAAPFHMWTPDVYEGAPTSVTAFMSAATKVAALLLTLRILVTAFPQEHDLWTIAARGDRRRLARDRQLRRARPEEPEAAARVLVDLERRLHADRRLREQRAGRAGAPLLPDSLCGGLDRGLRRDRRPRARARPRRDDRRPGRNGLGAAAARRRPCGPSCSSFAGLPPTGGFLGKFYVFSAAYDHGWLWLVIVGVLATAVSLYYYLDVIRALYLRPSAELQFAAGGQPPRDALLQAGTVACVVVVVGSFFAVQPLIDLATKSIASL